MITNVITLKYTHNYGPQFPPQWLPPPLPSAKDLCKLNIPICTSLLHLAEGGRFRLFLIA